MAKGPLSKTKTKRQILQDVISLLTHRPLFALSLQQQRDHRGYISNRRSTFLLWLMIGRSSQSNFIYLLLMLAWSKHSLSTAVAVVAGEHPPTAGIS